MGAAEEGDAMTPEQVQAVVDQIRAKADDDEAAHSLEDDLREGVLKAIAAGAENPAELARLALTTSAIEFARWCA